MMNRKSMHAFIPALLSVLIVSPAALGDIYQWKWVYPGYPSEGRQVSSALCPDGAGLVPQPGLYAYNKNLTQAWLPGTDLTGANFNLATLTDADFWSATLTDADLTGANLTDVQFGRATLRDAEFTGATIAGANFQYTTRVGFTRAQFESTASYASGDLAGVGLIANDLSSWNFAGKNLTDAEFRYATLTDADFTGGRRLPGPISLARYLSVLPARSSSRPPVMLPAIWPGWG